MTRVRMVFGYGVAVVFVVWAAGTGRTGDHGGPETGKTVCLPVPDQKKVTTKTFSSKTEEFCLSPIRGLFGSQPQCGPVRTKRVLVVHTQTREEPTTKYVPVVECAQPVCPPAVAEQPAPGAVPPFVPPAGTVPVPAGPFPR
ncbi:hypothetical protein [Frigoriglobus tundricola]|uniref:Uncharacterized protein n=1 Tax=Frigoriglobus tundricola TaxID=2774151 RepID=A0A6M5Z5R8_9BACT|nr:hypothetical protein [Frigoriglobus tundricola]QJX00912.1 hypothetical protein FTUN_8550 [Frigoriglobus tundricola]